MKRISKRIIAILLAISLTLMPLAAFASYIEDVSLGSSGEAGASAPDDGDARSLGESGSALDGHIHTGDAPPVAQSAPFALAEPEPVEEIISYGLYPRKYLQPEISGFSLGGDGTVAKFVADNHAMQLRADGRLLVWGDNRYGQLGLGSAAPTTVYEPTELTFFKKLGAVVMDIAVCEDASFVLTDMGLYSFGKGTNGRLGLGHTNNAKEPTLVPNSQILQIKKLYPGKEFVIAETEFNTLYAWGRNNYGQLGTGDKVDVNAPVKIMDSANVKRLTTGADFVTLQKQDNSYWIWGNNDKGQYGFNTGNLSPKNEILESWSVCSVPTLWEHGNTHTYATCTGRTWSSFADYQGVKGNVLSVIVKDFSAPKKVVTEAGLLFEHVSSLALNWNPTGTAGSAVNNTTYKFLGTGTNHHDHSLSHCTYLQTANCNAGTTITTATAVATFSWQYILPNAFAYFDTGKLIDLQLGNGHGIANIDGTYYGWGGNASGQQGTSGDTNGYMVPLTSLNQFMANLNSSGDGFSDFKVAGDTAFILSNGGSVYAVGANTSGKGGIGSVASTNTPEQVIALHGKSIADIVPGRTGAYFIDHDGSVFYSGANNYGQSGLGESQKDKASIEMPEKIETFKYSSTELPPSPPDNVEAPTQVEAGTQIEIKWATVPNAAAYELKRSITLKDDSLLFLSAFASAFDVELEDSEIIYNGEQNKYTDTAGDTWSSVTYSVHALNTIGDYSSAAKSNDISVLAASGGGNNGGDNNNGGGGGGITADQMALILAAISNSSGGGMTADQMALIMANMNQGGANDDLLAAALSALRRSGTGGVNVTVPETDNKDMLALISTLAAKNGGQSAPALDTSPTGTNILDILTLAEYLSAKNTGETLPAVIPENELDTALRVATLKALETFGAQLTGQGDVYQAQTPEGIMVRNICVCIILLMIIASIALVAVRLTPEKENK